MTSHFAWSAPSSVPQFVSVGVASAKDAGEATLPEEEQMLLPSSASATRRLTFTMGRVAARRALAAAGLGPVSVGRGDGGEPIWPARTVGSIAHTSEGAIAMVADASMCAGLGVDVENRTDFAKLADYTAFGDERKAIVRFPPGEQSVAALLVFSAKESLYKALYPHISRYFGFEAALVSFSGDTGLEIRLAENLGGPLAEGVTIPVHHRSDESGVVTVVCLP